MNILKALLVGIFISLSLFTSAQDSLQVMSLNDFYALVISNHPLAKQANTLPAAAKSEISMARGGFDPLLKSDFENKEFSSKNYWTEWESKLTLPLWFGPDLKLGYDNNTGKFLDNSRITPDGGLTYVGITVPLGQGLLIDQRRAALRIAQLSATMADAEKVKLINKLLLEAAKDYWDWTYTFYRSRLQEESLRLATVRFNAIRDRVLLGDLPALDSLEAFIEVQNRENVLNQALLELNNAKLIAGTYLWDDSGRPVELSANILPGIAESDLEPLSSEQLAVLLQLAGDRHPELVKFSVKLDQLAIERRWAAEKLRPKLNLDYNFLRSGDRPFTTAEQNWSLDNNYKLGVNFSVPLFLRNERGKLSLTKIKISQTAYEQQQATRDIQTQVLTSWNELVALRSQLLVQEAQVVNTARMLDGEQYRFDNGDGSVFLINTRENALINSRIKLVELKTKFAKSKAFLYWSSGNLSGIYQTE